MFWREVNRVMKGKNMNMYQSTKDRNRELAMGREKVKCGCKINFGDTLSFNDESKAELFLWGGGGGVWSERRRIKDYSINEREVVKVPQKTKSGISPMVAITKNTSNS